jgi:hypothetical protein
MRQLCEHDHNSLIPFSYVVVPEGHEQLIPLIVIKPPYAVDFYWDNIQSSIPRAMRKALAAIGTQPPKDIAYDLKKKRKTIGERTTRAQN